MAGARFAHNSPTQSHLPLCVYETQQNGEDEPIGECGYTG
jgi:hypothetical protein